LDAVVELVVRVHDHPVAGREPAENFGPQAVAASHVDLTKAGANRGTGASPASV
jgi:hypothetical protein